MNKEKKGIFLYGNCLVKIIAEYIREATGDQYNIQTFYIMDSVGTFNMKALEQCNIFIYQHVSEKALHNQGYSEINTSDFSSENLLKLVPKSCIKISFPSVYFTAYFPKNISQVDFPKEFPYDLKKYVPNYCFDKTLFQLLLKQESVENIVKVIMDPSLYSEKEIKKNLLNTYTNLKEREEYNKVDIPLSDYIFTNCSSTRLCMTTNHPSKEIFQIILQEISKLTDIDISCLDFSEDKMEKVGRPPILPSVSTFFGLVDNPPFYSLSHKFDSIEEYVQFFHKKFNDLLFTKN